VVRKLLTTNVDVNAAAADSYRGRTALQAITEEEHLEMVKRLLTTNVNVNAAAANYEGRTALQAIAVREHLEVMKRLLTADVDVNVAAAADDYDRTALQAAAEHEAVMMVLRAAAGPQ
jgi:ankyrin repeat protein